MDFTKAKERIAKSDETRVKVTTFKRRHFKKRMSTNMGFGFQDMRKSSKSLVKNLTCNGYDIEIVPVDISEMNMKIELYVNK